MTYLCGGPNTVVKQRNHFASTTSAFGNAMIDICLKGAVRDVGHHRHQRHHDDHHQPHHHVAATWLCFFWPNRLVLSLVRFLGLPLCCNLFIVSLSRLNASSFRNSHFVIATPMNQNEVEGGCNVGLKGLEMELEYLRCQKQHDRVVGI